MLVIIFILLLFSSLVLLHEWGHFIMARRNGVQVDEFGFGFPPKIYGRTIKGTLYSLNLLPLGGFVRLKGEDSSDMGEHTFGASTLLVKTKILLAGVIMNLLSAIVLLYLLCITGIPGLGAAFEPSFLHPSYAQPRQLILSQVDAGSPAAKSGLKRGDFVLAGNGQSFEADEQLHNFTHDHAGQTVTFTVREGKDVRDVQTKLRDPGSKDGFLGVVSQQVYKLKYDPLTALVAALYITGALFVATIVGVFQLLIHIPTLIIGLFGSTIPQAAESASGPVGIIFILKSISSLGLAYLILFMANISVALAAFNVLPLPALDGGRLAVILVQRVLKRQMSVEAETRFHTIGFMLLIGLMIVISIYDFRKFF